MLSALLALDREHHSQTIDLLERCASMSREYIADNAPLTWLLWRKGRGDAEREPFVFRFTIPLLALCLLCADFAYFHALRDPAGLISLVASIRRGSTLIAFAAGVFLFKEANGWKKLPPVLGIVAGIVLTLVG